MRGLNGAFGGDSNVTLKLGSVAEGFSMRNRRGGACDGFLDVHFPWYTWRVDVHLESLPRMACRKGMAD